MGKTWREKLLCLKIFVNKNNRWFLAQFRNENNIDITISGVGYFKEGQIYDVEYKENTNEKYKNTYQIERVYYDNDVSKLASHDGTRDFLCTITSERLVNNMYNQFYQEELVQILMNKDLDKLTQVDGIGESLAKTIFKAFSKRGDLALAIAELSKFHFTESNIKAIVKHYKDNVELAVKDISDNIYCATEVNGLGFKKVDNLFLLNNANNPNASTDIRRIKAYCKFAFEEEYDNGNSYMTIKDFTEKVTEYIPDVHIEEVARCVNEDDNYISFVMEDGRRCLSLKSVYAIEQEIAKRLSERIKKDNLIEIDTIDSLIEEIETNKGWTFTEEQKYAVKQMSENNVFMLQGGGGVGKTSVTTIYTTALSRKGYNVAQACLSGKAAENLSRVTGYHASTIHRLLKIGTDRPHDEDNQLNADVVIIDEISMVDAKLFLKLLRAMKPDAKLIMMGDSGQLDSIGLGVMQGMIASELVPTMTLTQIHRQAQDSAIINHSLSIRNGYVPSQLKLEESTNKAFGVNNDLLYILTGNDEESKIMDYTLSVYKKFLQSESIDDIQVICSTKSKGVVSVSLINYYIQQFANPKSSSKQELDVVVNENEIYTLRVGDRVINRKNTTNCSSFSYIEDMGIAPNFDKIPIFNGNTGKIVAILDDWIAIDFDGVGNVLVPINCMYQIKLGYAITVHSSQGSTIKNIIVAMPYHYLLNSRELLYTALTRASDKAVIITSPKTFRSTIKKSSKKIRKTNLANLIKEVY
ncbi:AAA family ATPase [Aerococcaceae bacterium zg-B36]|uniref:AAA family ATPase n=1 Tax=Aerococcaceae bacterium zg-252 TaxID=2796928 RepID=UPI001BD8B039|nr:AAA family ATPase [Aerococcaceae bacterium zg-B36]